MIQSRFHAVLHVVRRQGEILLCLADLTRSTPLSCDLLTPATSTLTSLSLSSQKTALPFQYEQFLRLWYSSNCFSDSARLVGPISIFSCCYTLNFLTMCTSLTPTYRFLCKHGICTCINTPAACFYLQMPAFFWLLCVSGGLSAIYNILQVTQCKHTKHVNVRSTNTL